jgi:hypothetical protein
MPKKTPTLRATASCVLTKLAGWSVGGGFSGCAAQKAASAGASVICYSASWLRTTASASSQ